MPFELLAAKRVNRIMRALVDVRQLPGNLLFLNRTPLVNATDGEIIASYTGSILMADIIADDQQAVVGTAGNFTFLSSKIPNIKRGDAITQEMLNLMNRINSGGQIQDDVGVIDGYLNRTLENLLLGVRQRMEWMIIGAHLDTLTYSKMGINFTISFGAPAALKVTPATAWSDATNAVPITDIQTLKNTAAATYGKNYNRLTMTTTAFQQMVATANFRNQSALYAQIVGVTSTNFPSTDLNAMSIVVGRILNMTIELYDQKYFTQSNAGLLSAATNFLPDTKVLLTDSADDNNGAAMDFANAIVTETMVADTVNMIGANGGNPFGGAAYGPVSYYTAASPDANPPGINGWAVARGMPRRIDQAKSAVLTIG